MGSEVPRVNTMKGWLDSQIPEDDSSGDGR